MVAAEVEAGVEPGTRERGGDMGGGVFVVSRGQLAGGGERSKFFGVELLNHAKAAKLALLAVEVAVVVGIASNEAVTADMVVGLDPLDDMDREGQAADPQPAVLLVLQIEFR